MAEQDPQNRAMPKPLQETAQKRNRRKRQPLSAAVRERWRQSALATRPWEWATGPKTAAGKAQAALNGKTRQKGEKSFRERKAELADVGRLAKDMENLRNAIQAAWQNITLYDKVATTS